MNKKGRSLLKRNTAVLNVKAPLRKASPNADIADLKFRWTQTKKSKKRRNGENDFTTIVQTNSNLKNQIILIEIDIG